MGEKPTSGNAVGSRRAAWRIIAGEEQKEKTQGNLRVATHTRDRALNEEAALLEIRDSVLALMDEDIIPSVSTGAAGL